MTIALSSKVPTERLWELLERFNWHYLAAGRSANRRYTLRQLRKFLWYKKIYHINQINYRVIQEYLDSQATAGFCYSSIKHIKTIISLFCKFLLACGEIDSDISAGAKNPLQEKKSLPHYLNDGEVDKCLQIAISISEAKGYDLYRPILLGLYAGLSVHEIRIATREWFDFDARLIRPYRPKVNKYRTIPMHPIIYENFTPGSTDKLLFPSPPDPCRPLSIRSWHGRLELLKFQVRSLRGWHDFRRTFAVRLCKAGISMAKLKRYMGHANINTTFKYYGEFAIREYDSDIELLK